jgi:hypothetical protein
MFDKQDTQDIVQRIERREADRRHAVADVGGIWDQARDSRHADRRSEVKLATVESPKGYRIVLDPPAPVPSLSWTVCPYSVYAELDALAEAIVGSYEVKS